jgi:transmembrane sensor
LTKPSSNFDPQQIGQLIIKSLSGQITVDEEIELTKWLSESKENEETYHKVQNELHKKLEHKISKQNIYLFFKNKSTVVAASLFLIASIIILHFYKSDDKLPVAPNNKPFSSPNGVILTLANGLNLDIDSVSSPIRQGNMLLTKNGNEISYIRLPNYPEKKDYNTIRTMFGKNIKIVFLDGSKVWLNAGSTIHYPTSFNDNFRKVNISGEAYFEIAPMIDSSFGGKIPFTVTVNGMDILVKGTKFNVQAYNNDKEIKTSLLEGCIEVKKGNQAYLLQPGNQAILSKDTLKVIKEFEIDEVLAWKKDMFVFQEMDIEPLMRQISRWYNVTVVYEDVIMDRFTMSVPRNLTLEQLLNVLQSTSKVHFKIENHTVIVSK